MEDNMEIEKESPSAATPDAADVENSNDVSPVFAVDNITVSFPPTVGIEDVAALKRVLDDQLLGCAVGIDTAAVEAIDAAVLQTLLVFCKEADNKGVFTDWESPSEAVLDAIRLLGLAGVNGFPEAA